MQVQCLKCLMWFNSLHICPQCNMPKDGKYVIKSKKTGCTFVANTDILDWCCMGEGEKLFNSRGAAEAYIRRQQLTEVEVFQRV